MAVALSAAAHWKCGLFQQKNTFFRTVHMVNFRPFIIVLNCTLRDYLIPSALLTASNIKAVKLVALSESVSQTVMCSKTDTQLVLLGGTSRAALCVPCADRHSSTGISQPLEHPNGCHGAHPFTGKITFSEGLI